MKKLIITLGLVAVSFVANGQNFISQSFFNNARSINVSNTISVTNISFFPGQSNIFGLLWTNSAGTRTIVTNAGNTTDLLKGAQLWTDRNGRWFNPLFEVNYTTTNNQTASPMNVFLRIGTGGSGANAAVTFTFAPVWDDLTYTTTAADLWSVAITASTTASVTVATNVPLWRWPGASRLELLSIVNGDTDASSQVTIDRCSLNGYKP